jgi:uncharacterized repeat protein (TIGR01451 family)
MKLKLFILSILAAFTFNAKAQTYVTIPDTNFVAFLQTTYPSCMSGNQMDITCMQIRNEAYLYIGNMSIYDLTGIQYFDSLNTLFCNDNLLTSLPPLPPVLCSLNCMNNQLTSLPVLPPSLMCGLECQNNNISCFPTFPNNLGWLDLSGNPFTCLPNYVPGMHAGLLAYPLCVDGDTVNNPNGCPSENGIIGRAYDDLNSNCTYNTGETGIGNIPFKIYDSGNNLIGQTYSYGNGIYQFIQSGGTYRVEMDTLGLPFTTLCGTPGVDSVVVLPAASPFAGNVNFDIKCKPGFDVGVQSIYRTGPVFPGLQHHLRVMGGDVGQWYNMSCAGTIAGQVQVTVIGPVTYVGPAAGALTPSVAGNVYTYFIPDFSGINNYSAFNMLFTTDVTATIGDQVCVNVVITPSAGDNNTLNNTFNYCYPVTNSYDPNIKEVSPMGDVAPGFQGWLTYTIHFQNTGNAPAMNIKLADTLDTDLDLSTFQVINYSHFNTASLMGSALSFNFPNIQLADSTSDPEGSKGFVQYRIKPKAGLIAGTTIKNTAHIYFDYNAPIVTNTTVNEFVEPLSADDNTSVSFSMYPNPGMGKYIIELKGKQLKSGSMIEVYNLIGANVLSIQTSVVKNEIDISSQPKGVYFVKISTAEGVFTERLIKQ